MAAVKLSKTLIIIIAVSGLVGSIVVLFLILRCCRRPKSTPLPPIQSLAHHREKELNYLPHPRIPRNSGGLSQLGPYGSDTSLLKPSRKPSFQTDESHGTPSSSHHSFLVPPSPPINVTYYPSPLSVEPHSDEPASIAQQYVPTTRLAHSASRARLKPSQSRTTSVASTHSTPTHVSTRSLSAVRGAPHSTLGNVQIVLPTPLAPQLQNHMVAHPSATGSYEEFVDRGAVADRWTAAPGRTTSWRPNSDAPHRRKTNPNSGHRYNRSLDTIDRPSQSGSQVQSRGRAYSLHSTQPQPLGREDTTSYPRSPDNQTQPPRVISQRPRDGQAGQPPPREGNRSSSHAKTNTRSRSRSISRSHQSPSNAQNIPFPQSVPHSHPYTPSSSADTLTYPSTYNDLSPPPVPPLPRSSQDSLTRPERSPPLRVDSITDAEYSNRAST